MARLRLRGPLHQWSDTALAATQEAEGGGEDRAVMVFLGPDAGGEAPSIDERHRALPWIGREAEGLLPLLAVTGLGSRNAWVHPQIAAVGLGHLVDATDTTRPPIRVAAELVASVADTLYQLGSDAHGHPGPNPEDVAVDAAGRTHLVGFSSPWPPAPLTRDPSGGDGQEALVWRLGVLLAQLLGGRIAAVHDESAHDAMVRRVLIRAMSRGGPLFPERYRDWLTGMLAWDPSQRPALSAAISGLREVADQIGDHDLPTWARTAIPALQERIIERGEGFEGGEDTDVSYTPWVADVDPTDDLSLQAALGADVTAMGTLPGIALASLSRDDETAETTLLAGDGPVGVPRAEPGTMPVGVGPPAAAMRARPHLPRGFLEDDGVAPRSRDEPHNTVVVQLVLFGLLAAVTVGMVALIGLVLWFGKPY